MKEKLALIVIAAAFSTFAFAQDQHQTWDMLDADKNGYISEDEGAAHPDLVKDWSEYDVNGDGQLDQDEFSKFEETLDDGSSAADGGSNAEQGTSTTKQ